MLSPISEAQLLKSIPLSSRILVKKISIESKGVIIIPDEYRDPSFTGEVISVGPGKWVPNPNCECENCGGKIGSTMVRQPVDVEPGDTIIFGDYSDWRKNYLGDKEYLIIDESDIRVVLSRKAQKRKKAHA